MPTDDTRRLLRSFGIAVTAYEDAVREQLSMETIRASETEARARLQDIAELIDRLRSAGSASSIKTASR
jgi:hypothetical protein